MFSFDSVARRVNYLMNTYIERSAPSFNIPNIDPDDVEILGTYPFRNQDRIFQIIDDEACVITNRSDFIVSCFKRNQT